MGAYKEVLKQLHRNQQEIIKTLSQAFDKQVEQTFDKIKEYRLPSQDREDTRTAKTILDDAAGELQKAIQKGGQVLNGDAIDRWLAGAEEIQKIWLAASARQTSS